MLIQADARLIPLRDGCVQCVVTSPPYWGLRDYGRAAQIGLETNPETYVATMVGVFDELWRVLADDGVVWLNLGDSYAVNQRDGAPKTGSYAPERRGWSDVLHERRIPEALKSKDLCGIPWRVAFALQADGWYLRSDVIWHKPNPMPESVTDRPTKAHEYLFLFTKSERYYYDADAIREPHLESSIERARHPWHGEAVRDHPSGAAQLVSGGRRDGGPMNACHPLGRNKRSVWTINTQAYSGAHFATMPEALVEPCILAGSRLGDLVYDPFCGSCTVLAVAERLGRRAVGTDLNPTYLHDLGKQRTAQRGLRW